MNIMEKYDRWQAARTMGLVDDPNGLNLPDYLWMQKSIPGAEPFRFSYTNYRGETSDRQVVPIRVRFGASEWHTEQWLMYAFDLDKWAYREFAMGDMYPCKGI